MVMNAVAGHIRLLPIVVFPVGRLNAQAFQC